MNKTFFQKFRGYAVSFKISTFKNDTLKGYKITIHGNSFYTSIVTQFTVREVQIRKVYTVKKGSRVSRLNPGCH